MGFDDGGILVDHSAVDVAAQDLHNAIKKTEGILQDFLSAVQKEQPNFTGEAATYYARKTHEWQTILADLHQLGQVTSSELVTSNNQFRETDKKTAAMFDAMNVGY